MNIFNNLMLSTSARSKIGFLFLLLSLSINVSPSKAQEGYVWSEPIQLFQVEGMGELHYPVVVPDVYGRVHVFWNYKSGTPGELDKIYYMKVDEAGWTFPVDIIAATPLSDVNVTISQDGFFYVTWQGIGDIISYSRAPIHDAEFVKNWSNPIPITNATSFYSSIVTSPSGKIYLAYPGRGNIGVFLQVLESSSSEWSSPRIIALNSQVNTGADYVQIGVSESGMLHLVWTEFYSPDNWPPRGVFYARSDDGGENWSAPVMLAGDGFDQINISVLGDDHIHVAWNGMVTVGGRYHSWSSDGGQTWSPIIDAISAGIGGTEGFPSLTGDSLGILHMLTTYDGCTWYTYFSNYNWAAPICISGDEARASNFIEESALAISEGNRLHAVFWDDRKRLWYTQKLVDAPRIHPQIIEDGFIPSERIPTPVSTPVVFPTITNVPANQQIDDTIRDYYNIGFLLSVSLLPVILLIVVVATVKFRQKVKKSI